MKPFTFTIEGLEPKNELSINEREEINRFLDFLSGFEDKEYLKKLIDFKVKSFQV